MSFSTQATLNGLERVMGIEPTLAAWEAAVLPLNYTRRSRSILGWKIAKRQSCSSDGCALEQMVYQGKAYSMAELEPANANDPGLELLPSS